jgi:antitoxin (DNA-binding transcriptional repressor) of toxin-antitoxin stability system
MPSINISEFRANLLKYLEQAQGGKAFTVTSHGKVLAEIKPPGHQQAQARSRLAAIAQTASIGDVVSPAEAEWDAQE